MKKVLKERGKAPTRGEVMPVNLKCSHRIQQGAPKKKMVARRKSGENRRETLEIGTLSGRDFMGQPLGLRKKSQILEEQVGST